MYQKQIIDRIQEQESRPQQSGAALFSRQNANVLRYRLFVGFQHSFSISDLVVQVRHLRLATIGGDVNTLQPYLGPSSRPNIAANAAMGLSWGAKVGCSSSSGSGIPCSRRKASD